MKVMRGIGSDSRIWPCSLDVIAMMDVLEHFADPVRTLWHCLKLLRPDGVMITQTPRYPEFVTHDHLLLEKNIPFIEHLKSKDHLYLFRETSVRRLFAQLGFEHIRFEPAIFAHYDMFLLAGRAPLKVSNSESIKNRLCVNSNGRMVQALLELSEQNAALTRLLHESEATALPGWITLIVIR